MVTVVVTRLCSCNPSKLWLWGSAKSLMEQARSGRKVRLGGCQGRGNSMGKGSEATVSLGGVRCDLTQPVRSWALLGGREGWATRVHSDPPPFLLHSQQKTELPVTENVQTIPPPYVVRTILVYSRPPCQPQFSLTEPMKVSETREKEGCLQPARRWLDTRRDFLTTGAGVPRIRFPESRDLWSWGHGVTRVPKATFLPLQKMFQCPYFFFDVVYIHNGADEKEEEMSWKVRGHRECGRQVDVCGRAPNPPAPALRERRPFSVRAFRASDANPLDYDLC